MDRTSINSSFQNPWIYFLQLGVSHEVKTEMLSLCVSQWKIFVVDWIKELLDKWGMIQSEIIWQFNPARIVSMCLYSANIRHITLCCKYQFTMAYGTLRRHRPIQNVIWNHNLQFVSYVSHISGEVHEILHIEILDFTSLVISSSMFAHMLNNISFSVPGGGNWPNEAITHFNVFFVLFPWASTPKKSLQMKNEALR